MKIKVFDTENNEFVEKFVIDQDGNVMVGDDYCGACDQPKYSTVEQPLLLRWLPDNMPDESRVYGQHSREFGVTKKIKQWAKDRGLDTADPAKQMLKLGEEYGELCQGMAKGNQEQIIDSIGDIYVVLTVLSLQLGLDINDCINQAYEEIKDRKGRMINGVFVKNADIVG